MLTTLGSAPEKGMSNKDFAEKYGVPKNTVSTWVKNINNILSSIDKTRSKRKKCEVVILVPRASYLHTRTGRYLKEKSALGRGCEVVISRMWTKQFIRGLLEIVPFVQRKVTIRYPTFNSEVSKKLTVTDFFKNTYHIAKRKTKLVSRASCLFDIGNARSPGNEVERKTCITF